MTTRLLQFRDKLLAAASSLKPASWAMPLAPVLMGVWLSVACVGPVWAAEKQTDLPSMKPSSARQSFAPAPGISLEQATSIARKHTGGRVLSASPRVRSQGTEYRVRMLVDGERVVTVTVDHRGRVQGGSSKRERK